MQSFFCLSQKPGLLVVSGIEETDVFLYRGEAVVVGLHRQVQQWIAYVPYEGKTVACSIVMSGGYIDNVNHRNLIEYIGQGGNDYKGMKHQLYDQTPEVGHNVLITSWKLKTRVRVIRRGYSIKEYCYGGVYHVTDYKFEVGRDRHKVYKFTLKEFTMV